jgi:hypothetical protein
MRKRIVFRHDGGAPRRWQIELAEGLVAAGHEVALATSGHARTDVMGEGFPLLVQLESLIYGIAHPLQSEASIWPSSLRRKLEQVDLVVDFGGEALSSSVAVPTLIPLYDGIAGEAAAVGAVLDGRSPSLAIGLRSPGDGEARLVAAAQPALEEPLILARSLDRVLVNMRRLLARAIERLPGPDLSPHGAASAAAASPGALGRAKAALFLGKGLAAKIAAFFGGTAWPMSSARSSPMQPAKG